MIGRKRSLTWMVLAGASALAVLLIVCSNSRPALAEPIRGAGPGEAPAWNRPSAALSCTLDLALTQAGTPEPVLAGETLSYTLVLTNNGSMVAHGVVVTDILPPGMHLVSAHSTRGPCSSLVSAATTFVTCELGDLAAADVPTSTFDCGDEGWRTVGDSTADSPQHVPAGGNPGGYLTAVDRSLGPHWYWRAPSPFLGSVSLAYGSRLTFDLRQSDASRPARPAPDVILSGAGLTLTLDAGRSPATTWTTYTVPIDTSAGWQNQATASPATENELRTALSWLDELWIRGEFRDGPDWGDLDNVVLHLPPAAIVESAPDVVTITVLVAIDSDVAEGTTLTHWTEARADEPDVAPADNVVSGPILVRTAADLALSKGASSDRVRPGAVYTYTLRYTNHGPSDAREASITDTLPAGVLYHSAVRQPLRWRRPVYRPGPPATVTWSTSRLPAGESAEIVFTVVAGPGSAAAIHNTAFIASDTPDPGPGNNSADAQTARLKAVYLPLVWSGW